MKLDTWTPFLTFSDLYEYYGLIDDTGGTNRSNIILTYLGKTGPLHQDDGFRLRSNPRPASGKHKKLMDSLEVTPCSLNIGDLGCYWIRIEIPKVVSYNYIGQCTEDTWGIPKRLSDHFRKLCSIPDSSDLSWQNIRGVSQTKRFKDASAKLKELGFDPSDPATNFFKKYVSVKFVRVENSSHASKKIHRIEGMAMAAYKSKYGEFPNLNDRNETIGLDGF
jgi:hypothetical protein